MTDKFTDPYVRFYIQNGVEVATMTAADFRAAMLERDHEIERLNETIAEWQQIHGTFAPSGAPDDVHHACQVEAERLRAELKKLRYQPTQTQTGYDYFDSEAADDA